MEKELILEVFKMQNEVLIHLMETEYPKEQHEAIMSLIHDQITKQWEAVTRLITKPRLTEEEKMAKYQALKKKLNDIEKGEEVKPTVSKSDIIATIKGISAGISKINNREANAIINFQLSELFKQISKENINEEEIKSIEKEVNTVNNAAKELESADSETKIIYTERISQLQGKNKLLLMKARDLKETASKKHALTIAAAIANILELNKWLVRHDLNASMITSIERSVGRIEERLNKISTKEE